jgi:hypothetical protein
VHSIHAVGLCTFWYLIYLIYTEFYPYKPWLGPKPSQSQPSLTALGHAGQFQGLEENAGVPNQGLVNSWNSRCHFKQGQKPANVNINITTHIKGNQDYAISR